MRKIEFVNGEYYHIFNRGVDKRDVFSDAKDYQRFLLSMELLNSQEDGLMIEWRDFKYGNNKASLDDFLKLSFRKSEPLVEIIAYCLNPNHYHFILKQVADKGVERFMHKLGTSHTKYYNKKQKRSGSLFQGVFKSVYIDSDEYILYLSAYINKNNFIHGYNKNDSWPYSSLAAYLGKRKDRLVNVNMDVILKQFTGKDQYSEFLKNNVLSMQEKKEVKRYLLEG